MTTRQRPAERPAISRVEAARLLEEAREDIASFLQRRTEDLQEGYRLMDITGRLYEAITGEEAPAYQVRMERAG